MTLPGPADSTTINAPPQQQPAAPHFALRFRREEHGPEIKRAPVPRAYLHDLRQELWREFALRLGMPGARFEDMAFEITPLLADGAGGNGRCSGFRVDVTNPRGEKFQRKYDVRTFADVASQVVQGLIHDGVLKLDDNYYYDLLIADAPAAPVDPATAGISFRDATKSAPLEYLSRALKPLVAAAKPVGNPSEAYFHVFYTARAYERAERCARSGAAANPPRETGAALVGTPCSCPESGEFFVVVAEALEATDAEEQKTSLAYTGKTWMRLQAIIRAMQSQPDTKTYRLLGQAHGHNFVPLDGAPPCDICSQVEVCTRTSVFVSVDDRVWTQAVFAHDPFAVCHIFGLNARREEVHGLYTLHENRLVQRGFYIIPDFDPASEA